MHYNIFSNTFSTREDSRIKANDCHTGYWHITDPEHPDYTPPTPSSHTYRSRADTLERAASPPTPSTSTRFPVPGESDNEEEEQEPLPAPQPRASTSTARLRTETSEGSRADTPHRDYDEFIRTRREEDLAEDTEVVTAQIEHGLDIQERYQQDYGTYAPH